MLNYTEVISFGRSYAGYARTIIPPASRLAPAHLLCGQILYHLEKPTILSVITIIDPTSSEVL
jgi:hypothetical protein